MNSPQAEALSGTPELKRLSHPELGSWLEYRRGLRMRAPVVVFDVLLNYAALGAGFAVLLAVPGGAWRWAAVVPCALWLGFWLHSHSLFLHEAAHYNLASSRGLNDVLANLMFLPLFGIDVGSYRRIHWQHHRFLGREGDTELSYLKPVNAKRFVSELLGIGPARAILLYLGASSRKDGSTPQPERLPKAEPAGARSRLMLLLPAVTHVAIIAALWSAGGLPAAVTWPASLSVYFAVQNLRQTLEHRAPNMGGRVLASPEEQGPVTRMFGDDLVSRRFGNAGFNRHLLHHWDPTVSYTQLPAMEAFLLETDVGPTLRANRTTYLRTFGLLHADG